MDVLRADVAIVGSGIAGLWSAKELVDQGLEVALIEQSEGIANGATTRNEGWLHNGTYHSLAIYNEADAATVTARTMYGHQAIVDFAPESIEHATSFALSSSAEKTEQAVERWNLNGVPYKQISPDFIIATEGVDAGNVDAAFSVGDKSVNSVALCNKLAAYIIGKGSTILTGTTFTPEDETYASLSRDDQTYRLFADRFLLAAGAGTKALVETITGEDLLMRYFKAHLLVTPRLTQNNIFYLDDGEAGIMSHGPVSIIGINRDGIQLPEPDYDVIPEVRSRLLTALARALPRTANLANLDILQTTACCKPDIFKSLEDTQSLNVQVFEVAPGYYCALPGKMTEAPYLGKMAADAVIGDHDFANTAIPMLLGRSQPPVTPRPADHLISAINDANAPFKHEAATLLDLAVPAVS